MNTQTELDHHFGWMREPIRVINHFLFDLPQAPQPYRQKAVRIVQERSHFFAYSFTFISQSGSLPATVWTFRLLRSGFEPLTQGFSVLCSNQLSYLNHFPKVCFLHRIAPYLTKQWRSLLDEPRGTGRPSFGQVFFAIDATKNKKEALRS